MKGRRALSGQDQLRPFLSWVGGKSRLVTHFLPFLPDDLERRVYREPFLGAGALFFAVRPSDAVLSDLNQHLIHCFQYVQTSPARVAKALARHGARSGKQYYYRVRDVYNESHSSYKQAARFIYLNKACFNGIFRVNRQGEFNVPYGRKKRLVLPSPARLQAASDALSGTRLAAVSFEEALAEAEQGDFVYLDPPYPPLNGTSFFRHYTVARFGFDDHKRLAQWVKTLDGRGCKVMVTNADLPSIRRLYDGFNCTCLPVTRYVTCKARKHRVSELIITNYEVDGCPNAPD